MNLKTTPGSPLPMGSSPLPEGINFTLFSRHAESVCLVLFKAGEEEPMQEIMLDPQRNKTGDIWHIMVLALKKNVRYGFRLSGPFDPNGKGHCFKPETILLDPYCRALCSNHYSNYPFRSLVVELDFDWQGDRPLNIPMRDTIIYEAHVRGFSRHESSKVKHPGTYMGIVEKIPYLKELGITAIELLPVTEFNATESNFSDPDTGKKLPNYWGYNPLAFFAPKASYSSNDKNGTQVNEFKEMVRQLHKAGIEIIVDIVFNHTGEGGIDGPTSSFRGLDNTIYYMLDRQTREYLNYSGCGNTVNCNHPLVRNFIINCLHYWVIEMHVDGFRFDLASILGRDQNGTVLQNPPVVELIAEDPILADTKIIAEAWDAAGLYQVGHFSSNIRWAEWNGRFRDDVRSFMCGRTNSIAPLATRIAGSSDLYQHGGRRPFNSVNFITSHDGFTLADLVSYNKKHNDKNGEQGRDGENNNISWNSGVEGVSHQQKIQHLRQRRIKTLALILFLSQGTPMLTAGDEFCRSQQGNNNAYCQDNEISWLDWRLVDKNKEMVRFFRKLIKFRKYHPVFRREDFFTAADKSITKEIIWQSTNLEQEDWSANCKTLAFYLSGNGNSQEPDDDFFIMLNGHKEPKLFALPEPRLGLPWAKIIDTNETAPYDIVSEDNAPIFAKKKVLVAGMGAVVLICRPLTSTL